MLETPDNLIFIEDVFTNQKPIKLERCVLSLKDDKKIHLGALCFRHFQIGNKSPENKERFIYQVEKDTFDRTRYDFIGKLIDELRLDTRTSAATKRNRFLLIAKFIQWIGKNEALNADFSDQEAIQECYVEYTKYLVHRKLLKDGESQKIKNNYASMLQKKARIACSLITGVPLRIVEFWATPIRQDDRDSFTSIHTHNPITDRDKYGTFGALCCAIDDAWRLLVARDIDCIRTTNGSVHDVSLLNNDKKFDEYYNKIVIAAAMTFMGATGANLQVAVESVIDDFKFEPTSQGLRGAGVKNRAKGKVVHFEFTAQYKKIWIKWLEIRSLWLRTKKLETDLTFPYLGMSQTIGNVPPTLFQNNKTAQRYFTKSYGIVWVTPRSWRGFRSKLINKFTQGDIFTSAHMQDHSVSTALRHYNKIDIDEAAREISSVLDSMYDSAIQRARFKEHIDVQVVEREVGNSFSNTPVGECTSNGTLEPSKTDGFTEFSPKPDCRVKETCIFCDKYAVHADTEDIRKLLSLRYLINELKLNMANDSWVTTWSPYIYRIDEILLEIQRNNQTLYLKTEEIKQEVESGILDEFWKSYHETLYHLGVVS